MSGARLQERCDPRPSSEETPWVVGYEGVEGSDPSSVLAAIDEFERLVRIGAVPSLLTSDGDRRVGIGRSGWSRWRDLLAPLASGGGGYARMAARTTMLAWMVDDVTWNLRFEIGDTGRRPSVFGAVEEASRRMATARAVVQRAMDPEGAAERLRAVAARDRIMAAALAQAGVEGGSIWHQDERIMGGMGGLHSAPGGSLRPSERARRALDALPAILRIEHRRGRNPLRSSSVEIVTLYAPISLCMDPGDPMQRLRALASIPDGEVWWAR